ncbi:MAG: FG-GAP repeat protein [Chitinophagaceae bacterium]|nr:FG-GAP repeat protein [Chitinophagaceae bacterium]
MKVQLLYHGAANGTNQVAAATLESNKAGTFMGVSVAAAGDINGDGFSDVVIGAAAYSNGVGQAGEGAALIYQGSATGVNTTATAILESNQANAGMGQSVSSAGDVNGDGYSDIIIGAFNYDKGQTDEGAAFIYNGSATGITIIAADTLETNQAAAKGGRAVACAGDINGDGYSDVLMGAFLYDKGETDEGAVFVYKGSATGINSTATDTLQSNQADAQMGIAVAPAGDINGDGYSDIIAGAWNYDNGETDEGSAFVYVGSAGSIPNTAAYIISSNQQGAGMGYSVACAGDVNGDGYIDVIIGAPYYDNIQTNEGAIFIYHGDSTGLSSIPALVIEINLSNVYFGFSVAGAGDLNGDGFGDIIVGAYNYNNGQANEGAAFIYHGSINGIIATPATTLECNVQSAAMGFSVASAGDVNADGYADVIVGAPDYSNGQPLEGAAFIYYGNAAGISTTATIRLEINQTFAGMGYSVAAAGDVNGDGYGDVMIGARKYDNGQTDEGAVFIYHGSASGISSISTTIEGNKASGQIGNSVAAAGDVNGDGYSDVLVGASFFTNAQTGEGVCLVYYGAAAGINISAADTLKCNSTVAQFGFSVASAGDVNGDGYSDIVVGAPKYNHIASDEGAVFVFKGAPTGAVLVATDTLFGNQQGAFGISVASAGDINRTVIVI